MKAAAVKKKPSGKKIRAGHQKARKRLTNAKKGRLKPERIGDQTRQDILKHALEGFAGKPPVEVCGFIATDGKKQKAFRSPNRSSTPEHRFRTCPKAWRKVEDKGWEIVACYHSHVNESPEASEGDRVMSEKAGLPFVIVGVPMETWGFYAPTGWKPRLEGRPFVFGVLDCFTLIQDYYARELKIEIPDFEYEDDWWKPKNGKPAQDLYGKYFKAGGFVEVATLQKHDVLFIQIPNPYSDQVNHAAIYLGDGQILHHMQDRLSKREPYMDGTGYARGVRKIVRHKNLCDS